MKTYFAITIALCLLGGCTSDSASTPEQVPSVALIPEEDYPAISINDAPTGLARVDVVNIIWSDPSLAELNEEVISLQRQCYELPVSQVLEKCHTLQERSSKGEARHFFLQYIEGIKLARIIHRPEAPGDYMAEAKEALLELVRLENNTPHLIYKGYQYCRASLSDAESKAVLQSVKTRAEYMLARSQAKLKQNITANETSNDGLPIVELNDEQSQVILNALRADSLRAAWALAQVQ